jgi:hypothetical protein
VSEVGIILSSQYVGIGPYYLRWTVYGNFVCFLDGLLALAVYFVVPSIKKKAAHVIVIYPVF